MTHTRLYDYYLITLSKSLAKFFFYLHPVVDLATSSFSYVGKLTEIQRCQFIKIEQDNRGEKVHLQNM